MGYSVLQCNLAKPSVEDLRIAFRSVSCLTDYDAHGLAADAYGILVKNLGIDDAYKLQGALKVRSIDTQVVEDSSIPTLPATKNVRRLDCFDNAMTVYDSLGRGFQVEWKHVSLIAVGRVMLREFQQIEKRLPVTHHTSEGYSFTTMETEYRSREESKKHLVLEIVLTQGVARYSINAAEFNFGYLGPRQTENTDCNFQRLVEDMRRCSTNAIVNRGVCELCRGNLDSVGYPTKNAFYEEIVWLLWHKLNHF